LILTITQILSLDLVQIMRHAIEKIIYTGNLNVRIFDIFF